MFSLVQPTYELLGYTPKPHTSPSLEDVYSLAEEGVLFAHSEEIVPKPLRYKDIPVVYDMMEKSIANDPLDRYITDTPDGHRDTKLWKAGRIATMVLPLIANIYHGRMWTVNHGESIIAILDPSEKSPRGSKVLDTLVIKLVHALQNLTESKEQRARSTEFLTKFIEAVKKVLGEEVAEMYEVASLATHPDRQGRGYASTLVRLATSQADITSRKTYLGSSNITNRAFYASLGFEIVYTVEIGKENPSWEGKPILVDLMVREVKTAGHAMVKELDDEKSTREAKGNEVLVILD